MARWTGPGYQPLHLVFYPPRVGVGSLLAFFAPLHRPYLRNGQKPFVSRCFALRICRSFWSKCGPDGTVENIKLLRKRRYIDGLARQRTVVFIFESALIFIGSSGPP